MRAHLREFHNIHAGQAGIVIGNGPSLDNTPRELLDKYITFGSNKIFNLPFEPDYYSIIDPEMMDDCLPTLRNGWRPKREMFVRAEAGIEDNNYIYPIVSAGFSLNPGNFVVMGGTVTYALIQIAWFMGINPLGLVGVDHYYPKASAGEDGEFFEADGKDPDHFEGADGKPYFTPGRRYNRPELAGTEIAYGWAKELFEESGRTLVNLTPGSHLDVFPKQNYEEWL